MICKKKKGQTYEHVYSFSFVSVKRLETDRSLFSVESLFVKYKVVSCLRLDTFS